MKEYSMLKTGKAIASAWLMVSVSMIIRVYGLEEIVFFNKAAISLGVFFFGLWIFPHVYRHWQEEKRDFAIAYGMALALTFTELLGGAMRLEATRGGVSLGLKGILIIMAASPVMAFVAEPFFYRILHMSLAQTTDEAFYKDHKIRPENRAFLLAWGILSIGYLLCLLAFYPGLYCYDMVWQWQQFAQWDFNTHHPLIHTLLSGGLFELGKILGGSYNTGVLLYCVVQLLFLTGTMAYAIRFLVKQKTHMALIFGTGLFFLLFPFFPVLSISTTKDIPFAGFFLLVFVGVCEMTAEKTFYRGPKLIFFLACAVFMCLFRNNAVYGLGVMGLVLALAWAAAKWKRRDGRFLLKAIGLLIVCMAVTQFLFIAMEKGLQAKKGSKAEMMSLPMQQMARSYVYHTDEFLPEDKEKLLSYFDESCLLRYKYYVSDPVKSGIRMENFRMADFVKLWLRLGKQFPGEYVKSPAYNMMGLWYMGGDSSCYVEYKISPPFDEAHLVETRSKIPILKNFYSWFTDGNIQKHLPGLSVFFYTSFYSWCVAVGAGILAAKRKYRFLVLPLFLASYEFTLVFGPCILVRYMLCIMICIPVLAAMVFKGSRPDDVSFYTRKHTHLPNDSVYLWKDGNRGGK